MLFLFLAGSAGDEDEAVGELESFLDGGFEALFDGGFAGGNGLGFLVSHPFR